MPTQRQMSAEVRDRYDYEAKHGYIAGTPAPDPARAAKEAKQIALWVSTGAFTVSFAGTGIDQTATITDAQGAEIAFIAKRVTADKSIVPMTTSVAAGYTAAGMEAYMTTRQSKA